MTVTEVGPPAARTGRWLVDPIVLVAHGSRDPRSAATMRELGRRVALRWPAGATTAFLDFNAPSVPGALRELPAGRRAIVVPALLTRAYHGRVDLPEVLASVATPTGVTEVLGPGTPGEIAHPLLLAALRRRLSELDDSSSPASPDVPRPSCPRPGLDGPGLDALGNDGPGIDGPGIDGPGIDGVVLIAAGTSDAGARSTVEGVAHSLASELDVACAVGYASAADPRPDAAVARLRRAGARRIVAVSYFLAEGRLHDVAADSARRAGVFGVSAPLGAAEELVELILLRAKEHLRH